MSDVSIFDLASARIVVWDRQARRNAWSRATIDDIAAAIEAAGVDGSVRCVIVRGAGDHFSAGDDLRDALAADQETWAATIASFQQLTRVARAAPVPVIAAIDGVCIGGALEFAASCDLRFATDRSRFGTPEVRIGLVASNAGTLLLPEVLGETAARQLLLTGELMDATWAQAHGFVTELVAPASFDERIDAWARAFDDTSRYAVGATKAMLNERLGDFPAAALTREEETGVALFDGPDARQALADFARR